MNHKARCGGRRRLRLEQPTACSAVPLPYLTPKVIAFVYDAITLSVSPPESRRRRCCVLPEWQSCMRVVRTGILPSIRLSLGSLFRPVPFPSVLGLHSPLSSLPSFSKVNCFDHRCLFLRRLFWAPSPPLSLCGMQEAGKHACIAGITTDEKAHRRSSRRHRRQLTIKHNWEAARPPVVQALNGGGVV